MGLMERITVTAIRDFSHDGIDYHRGDHVELTPLEAAILGDKGCVSLTKPAYRTQALKADEPATPEAETATPKRRRYRRRDMVADE